MFHVVLMLSKFTATILLVVQQCSTETKNQNNNSDHVISLPIQGISGVIMRPTELKMQPTIHFQSRRGYLFFELKNIKHS
jgi:hypothetical protein